MTPTTSISFNAETSLFSQLNGVSGDRLKNLSESIQSLIDQRKKELEAVHHPYFLNGIGMKRLAFLPTLPSTALPFRSAGEHPAEGTIKPSDLPYNACLGTLYDGRPMLVLKIDLLDSQLKPIATVVETIYKRFLDLASFIDGSRYDAINRTTPEKKSEEAKSSYFSLFANARNGEKQFTMIAQLLDGERIEHAPPTLPGLDPNTNIKFIKLSP